MDKTYSQQEQQIRLIETFERLINNLSTTRSTKIARDRYVMIQKLLKAHRENLDIELEDARRLRNAADDAMGTAPCPWTITQADRLVY